MTRFICRGCGPTSPPCHLESSGIDPYFCPAGDGSDPAPWEVEPEQEPDESELFDPTDV